MSKIKFAVVGCGHIGKRHATMIERNEEAELIALVDIRSAEECGLSDFADVPFFQSIQQIRDCLPHTKNEAVPAGH